MPTYDYVCRKCGKKFAVRSSIREHEQEKVRCPKCASLRVQRVMGSFFAVTTKKS